MSSLACGWASATEILDGDLGEVGEEMRLGRMRAGRWRGRRVLPGREGRDLGKRFSFCDLAIGDCFSERLFFGIIWRFDDNFVFV